MKTKEETLLEIQTETAKLFGFNSFEEAYASLNKIGRGSLLDSCMLNYARLCLENAGLDPESNLA